MPSNPERDCIHIGAVTGRITARAQATQAKILIVDDDELELGLSCDRLQSCGAQRTKRREDVEAVLPGRSS